MKTVADFLAGKSEVTLALFHHFVAHYRVIGDITLSPTKSMIGIAAPHAKVAYITQLGQNFIHVVFPFEEPHPANLCFQRIA